MYLTRTTPHGTAGMFLCTRNQCKDVGFLFFVSKFALTASPMLSVTTVSNGALVRFSRGLNAVLMRHDRRSNLCGPDAWIRWISDTLCRDCDCGKVELGERMALQVFAETESTALKGERVQAATDGWTRDWTAEDVIIGRAEKDLRSIALLARANQESKERRTSQVYACTTVMYVYTRVSVTPRPYHRRSCVSCNSRLALATVPKQRANQPRKNKSHKPAPPPA